MIIHLPPERRPGVPVGDGVERRGARRLDHDGARRLRRRHRGEAARSSSSTSTSSATRARPTSTCCRPSSTVGPTPRRTGSTPSRSGRPCGRPDRGRPRRRFYTPNRLDVVDLLAEEDLLPAIYFIFSRAACDDAVATCLDAGVRLTTTDERERIREIVEAHIAGLDDADLRVLGYARWSAGLEAGVAAHHAGMVPPFKEAVEACFAAGLVKVVFATETLALGINMPARTVVIEKLTKFTGERHEFLTPGDYTQLTGRAGRRGIDPVGHAVVLWSPFVPFEQVAALAASRSFRLTSAFRPTYNMAANLVQRYEPGEAHHLLNLSLRAVPGRRVRRRHGGAAGEAGRPPSPRPKRRRSASAGGVEEYAGLLQAEEEERRKLRPGREEIAEAVARLRPGDIIDLDGPVGRAGVISAAHRKGEGTAGVRVRAVTARRKLVTLGVDDFDEPPEALTSVEVPSPYLPNSTKFRLGDGRAGGSGARAPAALGRRPSPTPAPSTPPATPSPRIPSTAAPTGPRTSLAVARVAAAPARGRGPDAVGQGSDRVAGPPLRPCAAAARGVGLPRRVGAHRSGRDARPGCTTSATC